MNRTFLLIGALAGFTGVAIGAFGAHALRERLTPDMLAVFETGVRYQMYHALAVIATGLIAARMDKWLVTMAGWLFTAGIVLFSGSLYAMTLTGAPGIGAVTPIGGVLLLLGWACLALAAIDLTDKLLS